MSTILRLVTKARGAIAATAFVIAAAPAPAATIAVDSLADTAGGAECTLRDAILAANSDSPAGGCPAGSGGDTIRFVVNGTITLGGTLPPIDDGLEITGEFHNIVISGNDRVPVFVVVHGTVYLTEVTVANGRGGVVVSAGAVLIVQRSTFSNNSAGEGGAILSTSEIGIYDSTFVENSADRGGAIHASGAMAKVVIWASTFVRNHEAIPAAVCSWPPTSGR